MEKTYVFEGKTTNEAVEKGLKELAVSKNMVDIKVLESEEKRSFFSILTPRVVKVEMTLKENANNKKEEIKNTKIDFRTNKNYNNKEKAKFNEEELKIKIENFLDEFIKNLPKNNLTYNVTFDEDNVIIDINGEDSGYLIGYRGEVLNSLQNILSNIFNKDINGKVKIMLNIGGYREKRKKDLENLADKIAKNVVRTKKAITIEPMTAFERKIIHLKLQDNDEVVTHSVGEEPYRKIVVSLKNRY